jgi:nucleoside-diphosphate-sugar epimerase
MAIASAFVTGSTGLLGNNLVRLLVERGVRVTALSRSRQKAQSQFAGLDVDIVEGDMADVAAFSESLAGHDIVFHTAAYFRDSYKGGSHWDQLFTVNVTGTERLLEAAYRAGIRRFVHTSSIAVLHGEPGQLIDETMERRESDADDYYRSKILADRAVFAFLDAHPDMNASFVLPGWMFGPGDVGPTSAGQTLLDLVNGKLPGVPPGSFSVVDARDVAFAEIAAAEQGRRGERYLAAGRTLTMAEVAAKIGAVTGIKVPHRVLPLPLLYLVGFIQEARARLTGKPALLSLATVRLLAAEAGRTQYDPAKSAKELGLRFRPAEETFADVAGWYARSGWFSNEIANRLEARLAV